ncbi:MAG TPA: hypothetical protein VH479_24250, partial [Acidimicrobiales bacterium]
MTGPGRSIEDRLSDALSAEGDRAVPSPSSLDTIRGRVGAVRRRRRAALVAGTTLAVVAVAVAVPLLVGSAERVTTDSPPASSPTSAPPGPGTTAPPATTVPGAASVDDFRDTILWPSPDDQGFTEPEAAALSFLTDVVGVSSPPLSSFRAERPDLGAYDLYDRAEDGSVRT